MLGLYLNYYDPYPLGLKYLGKLQYFNSYTHQLDSTGGFISADIELNVLEQVAEDWLEHGLGRMAQVKDNFTNKVFRGVANSVALTIGSDTETRGPLFDIGNRMSAIYTPRDFSVYPPVDGSTTTTTSENDTDSQAQFGIIEKVISAGATTEENAEKIRDTAIFENSYPKTTGDLSNQPSTNFSLTINLAGNYMWLKAFIYNNFTPALITIYDKIVALIAADPNGIISNSVLHMEDNTYPVEQLEDKNRYAWDIIAEQLDLGNDVDDRKRSFGIYDDDMVVYRAVPSTAKYLYKLNDQRQCIKNITSQAMVMPWMVRPGDWIYVPDWLLGRRLYSPTALNQNPRYKYIQTVNFTAPFTVSIQGTPLDNLSRMLAKITYTGGIY